ncbi:MAG: hypothetical protein HYU37_21405 [Acidobacteria bacterium]|nr:hypothetical protein [Acidobacteriota bacterium]
MLRVSRPWCALLVLCIVHGLPTSAFAEGPGLSLPTFAAGTASAADWASTYHALKYYRVRESNPLLRALDHSPGSLVTVGAVIDAGAFSAWNLTVGRRHERMAAAGLWAAAAFRAYLVFHNLRTASRAARR